VKLVTLGTNGAQPTDDGQTACYMIPELGIVLDAGSGMYRVAKHMQTESLDIYISHAHTDHTLGLGYLFVALMEKNVAALDEPFSDDNSDLIDKITDAAMRRVRIHAAEETLKEIKSANYFLTKGAQWLSLDEREALPGGGTITRFFLQHTGLCHGFKLEWPGHSLAYVTDTTADPNAPYVDSIRGVDVLLHECYLPDRLTKFASGCGHSVTSNVAEVAAKANVGRLIFIHNNTLGLDMGGTELDTARRIFPATELSWDRMEIQF
jgi:ribonuclease Z